MSRLDADGCLQSQCVRPWSVAGHRRVTWPQHNGDVGPKPTDGYFCRLPMPAVSRHICGQTNRPLVLLFVIASDDPIKCLAKLQSSNLKAPVAPFLDFIHGPRRPSTAVIHTFTTLTGAYSARNTPENHASSTPVRDISRDAHVVSTLFGLAASAPCRRLPPSRHLWEIRLPLGIRGASVC